MASTTLRSAAGKERQGFVGRPSWVDLQAGARPPTNHPHGAGRMDSWLGVLRVFRFRAPPSEDRGSCPVESQRPHTPEVPLRRRMLSRAPWVSHESRVHCGARRVSAPSFWKGRGCLCLWRRWGAHGQPRTPLDRLPALRTTSYEGSCTREDTGQNVQVEAGATVRASVKLRDMNVAVRRDDERFGVCWMGCVRRGL